MGSKDEGYDLKGHAYMGEYKFEYAFELLGK